MNSRGGARHDYTCAELRPWARQIREETRQGRNVYAYFNDDANTGALNAKMLPGDGRGLRRATRGSRTANGRLRLDEAGG